MTTTPVTPDQSGLAGAVPGGSAPQAPQITADPSTAPVLNESGQVNDAPSAPGGSRLSAILGAVARVASTAMSGIGDKGRPGFTQGLGEGARAENAAQATQSDIKFKDFDTQVRLANLHHQDQELQLRTQEQNDAHQKAQDVQSDWDEEHGISYDPHPNDGQAVMDTLKSQTATNGAASVPAGTHLSADGQSVNVPDNSDATQAGLLAKYKQLQGPLSLPALPQNAQFVPQRMIDVMTHKLGGYKFDGTPIGHDDLPTYISNLQSQRDALAKSGNANPYQLQTVDNTLGIMNAQLKALDTHATTAAQQAAQAKKQGEIAAENSPEGQSLLARQTASKATLQDNAAGNKPQKAQNLDTNGNPVWVPGVSADEKKKAELSENVVFNSNNIASILARRPDIIGKVAGRITTLDQMAGTNDPDITSLQQDMHNIAMANVGIHGMRSNDAVHDVETNILNKFKNGPQAIGGALKASADSVQTFIDNARPATYKTHSKNGGAIRSMVPQQGQ